MKYLRVCTPFLFTLLLFFVACQKEMSYELNKIAAHGSLQSDFNSECLPKNVNGAFIAAAAVTDENYIEIEINIASPGSYAITTDTLNGYSFSGVGNITKAGTNTIKLLAHGTPLATGINNFLISFDTTFCYVPVTVLPVGTGAAVFTLKGSGSNCMDALPSGVYAAGTPLTLSNKVAIKVDVTGTGTYNIMTTSVNGMVFAGSGVLTDIGEQTIYLTATGTPVDAGDIVIPITAGTSSCSFTINVTGVSLVDYFPRTANSNWSYNVDLDGDNVVDDSLLVIATPLTANKFGNTFTIFIQTNDAAAGYDSSGYYRKSGNDYSQNIDAGSFVGLDNPLFTEENFLKDNSNAGTTWTSAGFTGIAGTVGEVTLRSRYTILQKDVSVNVGGTSYPNTIVVEQRIESYAAGTWVDLSAGLGTIKNYYSRNIGLIKVELLDGAATVIYKQELRRYQVF